MKTLFANIAFVFAIAAAFAFSSPKTARATVYQSFADDSEGLTNCTSSSGVVASSCLTTNTGLHCKTVNGKFVFALSGCVAPLEGPE